MFALEYAIFNYRKSSPEEFRVESYLDSQRQWMPHEPGPAKDRPGLPYHGVYAQNDTYLEVDNPGWGERWAIFFALLLGAPFGLYVIFIWFGMSIYPLFTGQELTATFELVESDKMFMALGWLIFIGGAGMCAVIYVTMFALGGRTLFFCPLRGRIRFNRKTRKVYVLRPKCCGGNAVFEWDRLRALMEYLGSRNPQRENKHIILTLYHPPWDTNDPEAKGEDLIPVGEGFAIGQEDSLAEYWEYIRIYMEKGPVDDNPPKNMTTPQRKVSRRIPFDATTYCGRMGLRQYRYERKASLFECLFFLLSQITCFWPRFPPEWESDSGLGEPEDNPVQTGAIMTAAVYLRQGKLSRKDEIAMLKIWGTPEALKAAMARKHNH